MSDKYLETFLAAYIEAALWSSTYSADEDGNPVSYEAEGARDLALDESYDADDLAPETLGKMRADCKDFIDANIDDLLNARDAAHNGHDFWLTRNGHGAGFWDRGLGELGDRLTEASTVYGESDIYVGDDGLLYVS